jgi:hypothetical protein
MSGLLSLVGTRRADPPLAFALRSVGLSDGSYPDAAALLAAARERSALTARPVSGDLVVFASGELIGIVTGTDGETVEFVYLLGRVVRRGVVTPATPSLPRDRTGRARNTFVIPYAEGEPPDRPHLAGEALTGFLARGRLL